MTPHVYTEAERKAMDAEFNHHEAALQRMQRQCHRHGHRLCIERKRRRICVAVFGTPALFLLGVLFA